MDYISEYCSPLGQIKLASDGENLVGLWFNEQKYYGASLSSEAEEKELPIFAETKRWLDIYFSGKQPDFTPALSPRGTEFRKRVWNILLSIPYGEIMTYGEISEKLASEAGLSKMSAQAVGGAVGHNPISIVIPCHRVIGSDGSLTGYAGGIEKKLELLKLEGTNITNLYVPSKGTAL